METNTNTDRNRHEHPRVERLMHNAETLMWLEHGGNPIPHKHHKNGILLWPHLELPEEEQINIIETAVASLATCRRKHSHYDQLLLCDRFPLEERRNIVHEDPFWKYFWCMHSFMTHFTSSTDRESIMHVSSMSSTGCEIGWMQDLETDQQAYMLKVTTMTVSAVVHLCGGRAVWKGSAEKHRHEVFLYFFEQAPLHVCKMIWGLSAVCVDFEQIWGVDETKVPDVVFFRDFCRHIFVRLAELVWKYVVRPGACAGVALTALQTEWKNLPEKILTDKRHPRFTDVPGRTFHGYKNPRNSLVPSVYTELEKLVGDGEVFRGRGWVEREIAVQKV